MSGARRLVVSVHDVTPESRSRVESMLEMLTRLGIARRSLLVVPNFRGTRPLDADEDFCAWLRGCRARGDEIVLHGYEHVGVGRPRTAGERLRNRWFTQGEGEFLSLDYHAAFDRIARGQAMLRRAGLHPQGFVAPAWLITRDGLRAARDLGFQYTNTYLTVADLARERRHWVPSFVFGPGHLDEDLGIALQRGLALLAASCPVVRVVLHPPCVDHRARLARVLALIDAQRLGREPITYLQLLEALRRPAGSDADGGHVH